MDWMALFNVILGNFAEVVGSAVALILISVVCSYVVPWLEEKRLYKLVKHFMAAAEAEFGEPGSGLLKKEWVFAQLDAMGIKYNRDIVDKFINGFTLELTAAGVINNREG